jgi:hypothetical protein
MEDHLDEVAIARLISVQKPLPDNWELRLKTRPRAELSQKRAVLPIQTPLGEFKVIVRESTINSLSFSVILGYLRPNGSLFRLRRYNGLHAPAGGHINRLEHETVAGYHVHQATLRYQQAGLREDAFAVSSTEFADVASALRLMFRDCNFNVPAPKSETAGNQLGPLPPSSKKS